MGYWLDQQLSLSQYPDYPVDGVGHVPIVCRGFFPLEDGPLTWLSARTFMVIQPGGRRTPPGDFRPRLMYSQWMDHRIAWIAAKQQEFADAASWELWAALCFLTGTCVLLSLVMWWIDSYGGRRK